MSVAFNLWMSVALNLYRPFSRTIGNLEALERTLSAKLRHNRQTSLRLLVRRFRQARRLSLAQDIHINIFTYIYMHNGAVMKSHAPCIYDTQLVTACFRHAHEAVWAQAPAGIYKN